MARIVGHLSSDTNPFKGRRDTSSPTETVLHRFVKPGGRVSEIRERKFTLYKALEFLFYIDGHFHESWKFHGARLNDYPGEPCKRREWFREDGWTEDAAPQRPAN